MSDDHGALCLNADTLILSPFQLGLVVATPGALAVCSREHIQACLAQHARGQWGLLDADDAAANDRALVEGLRVLSAYEIDPTQPSKGRVWIITEADRSATTILLPGEYP